MKKYIFLAAAFLMVSFAAQAQNYMVVNSEKIFKSIAAFNKAQEDLDKLAEQYQKNVDEAFNEVEQMFNAYQTQKAGMNATTRQQREDQIINKEKEINKYQESIFGQEGELMKKRVELIKPIQEKVFNAINLYAESKGYQVVLDLASNPTILYYAPGADKTEEIIKLVK